ncbi:hypothetical protein O1L44_28405 [Streptomyces noursei]|nr:hypothetical protein [Streptomyces noursei]
MQQGDGDVVHVLGTVRGVSGFILYGQRLQVEVQGGPVLSAIPVEHAERAQRLALRVRIAQGAGQFQCAVAGFLGLRVVAGLCVRAAQIQQGEAERALVTGALPVADGVSVQPVGVCPVAFGVEEAGQYVTELGGAPGEL